VKKGKNNWNANSGFCFTDAVIKAIEEEHVVRPFKSYVALYRWVKENHVKNIKYTWFLKHMHSYLGGKIVIDRSIDISIHESISALELIHGQCALRIMPRIKMLIILKKEPKITRRVLTQRLGVTLGSIIKWLKIYRQNGLNKLLENKVGSIVTSKVHNVIKMKFKAKSFDSFSALYDWIKETHLPGVKYYTLHRYAGRHFSNELKMMKALLTIPVTESLPELETKLKIVPTSLKPRLRMLISIKENPTISKTNLSGLIKVVPGTLDRWCKDYVEGGVEQLITVKKKGRKKSELPIAVHNAILKYISTHPSPNITELHQLITADYARDMTYNRLYRYVRRQMGTATLVKPKHVRQISFARAVA
jgi:transposase